MQRRTRNSSALLGQYIYCPLAVDGTPSSHWGVTQWNQQDSIAEDAYGIDTAKNLGVRMAELAKLVNPTRLPLH